MERIRGSDAVFLHLERPDTPLHTLKVVILDTSRRGRAVDLAELRSVVGERLGIVARATQRVGAVHGFGRDFWVGDPTFHLDRHLDERTVDAPGERAQLDRLLSDLATERLAPDRPLWAMTLVHGLSGGRQAVAVRVHHALMDGLAALNTLLACTRETPGAVPPSPPDPEESVPQRRLLRDAAADLPRWGAGIVALGRDAWTNHQRAKKFRERSPGAPPFIGAARNFCNTRSSERRVCASSTMPFETFRTIAKATDSTINGVLHAVIARAMRRELQERGDSVRHPTIAVFGIAADPDSTERRWGNNITPTTVRMHSEQEDPLESLRQTALSCRQGVELRKETGLNMAVRWTEYTCRLGPAFQRIFAYRLPWTVNHVTTANVAGPKTTRWMGDVEIVDWISFAVTVPPSNFNITVYSYAGRMRIGLVTTPEVMGEPRRFLDRMEAALAELVSAVEAERVGPETRIAPAAAGA